MYRSHLSTPLLVRSGHLWLWLLSFLLFTWFLSGISHARSATGHGCASDNSPQPPISGTPVPAQPVPGTVLINEVLNQPGSAWQCSEPAGTFSMTTDSWLELYNPQNQPQDLYSVHAQISIDGGANWDNMLSAIAPKSFLVLFPLVHYNQPRPSTWNILLEIGGVIVDKATIPMLQPDQSYARVPDGSNNWQPVAEPTIATSNSPSMPPVTATSASARTSKSSSPAGGGNGSLHTPAPPTNDGSSTSWQQIQMPADRNVPTANPGAQADVSPSGSTASSPVSTAQKSNTDGGHVALVTVLIVLLAGACFYCWRLFRTP